MAEATRYSNVIKATADGTTITGPVVVIGIKTVGGASGITFNLKNANSDILYTATAGNSSSVYEYFDDGWRLRTETYTVNISAGSGTVYIYIK